MSIRSLNEDGTKWQIDYYPAGGKGRRSRINFEGAEAEARAYEMEIRRTHSSSIPVSPKIADAIPDWLRFYETNRLPNTHTDVKKTLKHLLPFFGKTLFSRITPQTIEQYKGKRLSDKVLVGGKKRKEGNRTVSKRTINKELSYFSSLVKFSAENGYCHPLPFRIKKFEKTRPPKPHIPHPTEIEAVIKKIEPEYLPVLLLLYDAGLRRSEALTLRAEDVFFKNGFILIKGKGEKERLVPITTDRLRKALERSCRKVQQGYLFINPKTGKTWYSIRKAIARAALKAGLTQRVYHHLFRHGFGTHGLAAGINIRALQGIMGHSDIKTTEGYAQLLGEFVSREGLKFNDYVGRHKKSKPSEKKKESETEN